MVQGTLYIKYLRWTLHNKKRSDLVFWFCLRAQGFQPKSLHPGPPFCRDSGFHQKPLEGRTRALCCCGGTSLGQGHVEVKSDWWLTARQQTARGTLTSAFWGLTPESAVAFMQCTSITSAWTTEVCPDLVLTKDCWVWEDSLYAFSPAISSYLCFLISEVSTKVIST